MKSAVLSISILILLFALACSSNENTDAPVQKRTEQLEVVDHGKQIFEDKCIVCHGSDGSAGITNAANLQTSKLDTASVLKIITHGKNGMASFSEQLGTGEIEQVTNYVVSLRK